MNLLNGVHPIQSGVNVMAGHGPLVGQESIAGLSPFIIPMSMPPGQEMPQQIMIPTNAPYYNMITPGLSVLPMYQPASIIPVVDPRQVMMSSMPSGVTQPTPAMMSNTTMSNLSPPFSARLPVAPPIRPVSNVRPPSPQNSTTSPKPTFIFKNYGCSKDEPTREETVSYPMSMSMADALGDNQPQPLVVAPISPPQIKQCPDENEEDGYVDVTHYDQTEDEQVVVLGDITPRVVAEHRHKIDMTLGVLHDARNDRLFCKRCSYNGIRKEKMLQHLVAHLVGSNKCEICRKVFIKVIIYNNHFNN